MKKFQLGQLVVTAAIAAKYPDPLSGFIARCVERHQSGDWGDLCVDDQWANDEDVEGGGQLLSSYKDEDGTEVWVVTDPVDDQGERKVTTILLPGDY